MTNKRPIIIIKKKAAHGGHHGGAWKVAYADFVTAMMALFIVLWLTSSGEKVRKSIAGYFNDPKGTARQIGTSMEGAGENVPLDKDNIRELKERLQHQIAQRPDLKELEKQIEIIITPEGMRIELMESKDGTFFESGSSVLNAMGHELLGLLAKELGHVPNRISIEGHTDAQPYTAKTNYDNWELSTDRANAARRLMQTTGLHLGQLSQVRGFADQQLRVPSNPMDPSNRRISVIVHYVDPAATEDKAAEPGGVSGDAAKKEAENKPGAVLVQPGQADGKQGSALPGRKGSRAAGSEVALAAASSMRALPGAKTAGVGTLAGVKSGVEAGRLGLVSTRAPAEASPAAGVRGIPGRVLAATGARALLERGTAWVEHRKGKTATAGTATIPISVDAKQ